MSIDASILNEVEHLRELGEKEKAALAEKIDLLKYAGGETIFNYGDPGHALYIIRSGEVEIYVKNDQGEKIVLETSKPGDIFGEAGMLDDSMRSATVTATSPVKVMSTEISSAVAWMR